MNGADTRRLIGDNDFKVKANDLLSKRTMREVVAAVMDNVFRQLENERSTISLLPKINNKLGLGVSQEVIDKAIPYLEIRHIFVHADGKPDQHFKDEHPEIALDAKGRISLNIGLLNRAYEYVRDLLVAIDAKMLDKDYISAGEKMP